MTSRYWSQRWYVLHIVFAILQPLAHSRSLFAWQRSFASCFFFISSNETGKFDAAFCSKWTPCDHSWLRAIWNQSLYGRSVIHMCILFLWKPAVCCSSVPIFIVNISAWKTPQKFGSWLNLKRLTVFCAEYRGILRNSYKAEEGK